MKKYLLLISIISSFLCSNSSQALTCMQNMENYLRTAIPKVLDNKNNGSQNSTISTKTIKSDKIIYSISDIHQNLNYYIALLCQAGISIDSDEKKIVIPSDRILTVHGDLFDAKEKSMVKSLSDVLKLSALLLEHNPGKVYFILGNHELFNLALHKKNPQTINQLSTADITFTEQFMNISNDADLSTRLAIIKLYLPFLKQFLAALIVEHNDNSKSVFLHSGLSNTAPISKVGAPDPHNNYNSIEELKVDLNSLGEISFVIKSFPHFTNKLYSPGNLGVKNTDFDFSNIHAIVTGHCSLIKEKENLQNISEVTQVVSKIENPTNRTTVNFVMIDSGLQSQVFDNGLKMISTKFFVTLPRHM